MAHSTAKPAATHADALSQLKESAISGSTQKRLTPIRIPPLKGTSRRDQESTEVSNTPALALKKAIPVMTNGTAKCREDSCTIPNDTSGLQSFFAWTPPL